VLAGALAVHELRYVIAGRHEDAHEHAYMPWMMPLVCAVLGLALAEFTARFAIRVRRGNPMPDVPAGLRWLSASSLLTGIFALQEVTERLVAHGRIDITDSLVVHGGWVALPLCFVVGAIIALLLRGARSLLRRSRGRIPARHPVVRDARVRLPRSRAARAPVIARHLAGRAPPVVI